MPASLLRGGSYNDYPTYCVCDAQVLGGGSDEVLWWVILIIAIIALLCCCIPLCVLICCCRPPAPKDKVYIYQFNDLPAVQTPAQFAA